MKLYKHIFKSVGSFILKCIPQHHNPNCHTRPTNCYLEKFVTKQRILLKSCNKKANKQKVMEQLDIHTQKNLSWTPSPYYTQKLTHNGS